jgi:hypothetical protein
MKINWKEIFSIKYNVWLVIIAMLVGLWLGNLILGLQGQALFSLARSLAHIRLIDAAGNPYPDEITVAPGATIQVGWNGHFVKPCQSSGWTQITAKNLAPVPVGPINQDETLSVTCTSASGPLTSNLAVHVSASVSSSGLTVLSPAKGEVWNLGQRYVISWNLTPGPQDQSNGTGSPATQRVTINLNRPDPPCLHQRPPCEIMQTAPYLIFDGQQSGNTYAWTVPPDLPDAYRGTQQITVDIGDQQAVSDTFEVGAPVGANSGAVLKVISPNGGEMWNKTGSNFVISWVAPASISKINISLEGEAGVAASGRMSQPIPIADNVDAAAGSYTVANISSIPDGQYRVTISAAGGPQTDSSDQTFTIQFSSTCGPRDLGCDANPADSVQGP